MKILVSFILGGITGILSGLFGIGGGIILVPLLVFLMGFTLPTASGTSLVALLLPVGALGAYEYYKAGKITLEHVKYGGLIAVGIFFGTFLGAKLATALPEVLLRKFLAVFLLLVAVRVWFST